MMFYLLFFVPGALALLEFVLFLFGRRLPLGLFLLVEILVVFALPAFFLSVSDTGKQNDCCIDDVVFSPTHRLSARVLIVLCTAAYFLLRYRPKALPPIVHVVLSVLVVTGVLLNIPIALHVSLSVEGPYLSLAGNIPIVLLFILALARDHRRFLAETAERSPGSWAEHFCWRLLRLPAIAKFPVLTLLCLPLLVCFACLMMLFGQRPDALVRAFTDTYHLGLSQLDRECDNVVCGGHYLCSVAANGHPWLVAPVRTGTRRGGTIVCNRQLLVSNAFEELVQELSPRGHACIRRAYDRVGDLVHRHYGLFRRKWFADVIYVLMKPLEWAFVRVLYTFDASPEDRIARQYLSRADQNSIRTRA